MSGRSASARKPAPKHLHLVEDDEASAAAGGGPLGFVRRRFDGSYSLDRWGLDADVTRLAGRLARLRWSASVEGLEHLPTDGPALLVANRRLGWSEPIVVASALLGETGRVIRPVGGTDFDPLGGLLRRLGALPARPEEVAAALRAGNLVLVPTRREPVRNRPGHLPIELLATAVATGVPLIPVGVVGWEFGRSWQVRVGAPVTVTVERPTVKSAAAKANAKAKADGKTTAKKKTNKSRVTAKGAGAGARTDTKVQIGGETDPAVEARAVGVAAVEVAGALDAMLAEMARRDLGHRILAAVPGVGGESVVGESPAVPGEWEGT